MRPTARPSMTASARHARFAAICLLLAIVHTWPMAANPGRHSRNDNGDAQLNEWILAWIAHQLPRDPAHLFEANIFYPAHDVLAFSEPLMVPAVLGAPLAWMGATPVLVHNLLLIAGFALSAFAGYLLIEAWTGDALAGLLTGSAFAFNTHTLTRLAHIQAVHIYGLPLALLLTDRLLRGGTWRDVLLLAACVAMLAYTSGYLLVFVVIMMAVVLLVRYREWIGARAKTVVSHFALAAVVAGAAIFPLSIPYRRVATEQHMIRTLEIIREYSATPVGYLAASGRIHMATWSARFFRDPVDSFFPGFTVIILTVAGVIAAIRHPAWRSRIASIAGVAIVGFVLSLGTATPVYAWVFYAFPPVQGLRAAARFGNLFLLGLAILAGLGLASWRARLPGQGRWLDLQPRTRFWIAIALVGLVNLEALRAPFEYRDFNGIPGIYRLLADEPGPVVLAEQPFYPRSAVFENAPYVLASTAHWRPLMNGYSGYTPESYGRYADTFWYFPEERSITAMKDAGVTHVMVHPAAFGRGGDQVIQRISTRSDMELLAVGPGGMRLYRLKR
jgi:hypothetical protein